ncbi:MAG: FAD:protein FMN transferase [Lachnospiraceae bacterium]|nr:FAD:protein FMN transferase [Lachnospiraceae bacterium]
MKLIIIPRIRIVTVIILALTASLSCSLTGCDTKGAGPVSAGRDSGYTRSGFCFDTLITITIYDPAGEELLDECFDMCSRYEGLLSMTVSGSDIYRINEADGGIPVTVSEDTIDFIECSLRYYRESGGKLDISVAPLTQLWTKARDSGTPPAGSTVASLIPSTGAYKLSYDRNTLTVTKKDSTLMLDPGALGKGYVADRLKEMLTARGVKSAIISLGGNILTIGSRPDGSPFRVGIRQPFADTAAVAASLKIKDSSVVTSGTYERYFTYDGELYHHILDTETGYPVKTDLLSATIISRSSLDGDALSTICLIMGLKDATELIENTPGVEAVFITEDNKLHYTEGAAYYLE